ncbi:MAG: DNA translocase FtsK [Planctomycetes bacterium]|nr:DNA translocase FtsK [Planctomycetota bacterium]
MRRAGWVALAGGWLLVIVALASFDSADWPSHAVAVHNDPTENLCGSFGAVIAYGAYHVIGIGTWLLAAGLAGLLVLTARGTRPGHLGVRTLGLILAALSVSSFHGLLAPDLGPLAGAPSGLVATAVVGELTTRFNAVGSFLILLASLGIGAVVAADRLVFAAVRGMLSGAGRARRVRGPGNLLRALVSRPKAALALATGRRAREADEDEDDEYEYEDEYEDDPDAEYEDEDEEEYEEEDDDEPEVRAEAGASKNGKAPPETDGKRARLTAQQLREKIAKLPVSLASAVKNVAKDEDIPRTETFKGYEFPTLELLENPEHNFSEKMEAIVRRQAEQLEEALNTYGIDAEVVGIESGPAVTLYSVQLAPGTKVAKISAISSDLARALRAQNIRIVPNMVGRTAIGIEVPNLHRERVRLKELMSGGHARKMVLPMFLGKDAAGEPLVADLTRMPHMLIAGTTGSGKSVCINSILMSWLYTKRPDELKLILVDPKMVEMSQFAEIPHLMCPVVTESARAAAIMEWAVERMEERYELMREAQVRDIASYNGLDEQERYERFGAETDAERARVPNKLPYVVFVVDELADMMMTCKEVEHSIVRVAQKARAVGIHLILATQRPQANVVTGLIKSNMPCRASFKVASGMDSRIVLDSKGAELLLGQGDMMFLTPHTSEIMRSQGTLVEDSEIRRVVRFLKTVATPKFERSLISLRAGGGDDDGPGDGSVGERDSMFDQAVRVMIESGRGSVSLLQRRLSIGYGRASRLVDQMSLAGIVGDHKGSVAREVLITLEEWEQMRAMEESGADDEDGSEPIPEREDPPLIETAAGPVPAELEGEYRN